MSNFVSRGGFKLEKAVMEFKLNLKGKICADFGSSNGGFVDCLLQNHVLRVYAVETGYGVLDWKLRNDERVVVMERTNAMHVVLPEKVDMISIDASWTKMSKIVPNALKNLKKDGEVVALVKPHYEAEGKQLIKGKLREEDIEMVLEKVRSEMKDLGVLVLGDVESPIQGGKGGNREFLFWMKRG